jgi:CRP/FNR family transcriptional regulator
MPTAQMQRYVNSKTHFDSEELQSDQPRAGTMELKSSILVLPKGRELSFGEKDANHFVWIVQSGTVIHEYVYNDGRRQILNFYYPNDIIFQSLICNQKGIVGCAAVDTRLRRAGHMNGGMSELRSLEFARACIEAMAILNQRRQLHAAVIGQLRREERLAFFLLEAAQWLGQPTSSGVRLELPMSRHDIADYLGLNVASISRAFAVLRREGVIWPATPKTIIVDNLDELARRTPVSDTLIGLYKAHVSRGWSSSLLLCD